MPALLASQRTLHGQDDQTMEDFPTTRWQVAFHRRVGLVGNRRRAYCHVGKHCMRCELAMRLTLHLDAQSTPGTATGDDQREQVWRTRFGPIDRWKRTSLGMS